MGIGGSIFLLALGAILAFAVNAHISGIDINIVGWVLMAAGLVGLVITIWYWNSRRRPAVVPRRAAGRDRRRRRTGRSEVVQESPRDHPPPASAPAAATEHLDQPATPECRLQVVGSSARSWYRDQASRRADRVGQRGGRAAQQPLQVLGAGVERAREARRGPSRPGWRRSRSGRPTPTRNSAYFSWAQVGVGDLAAGLPGDLGGQLGQGERLAAQLVHPARRARPRDSARPPPRRGRPGWPRLILPVAGGAEQAVLEGAAGGRSSPGTSRCAGSTYGTPESASSLLGGEVLGGQDHVGRVGVRRAGVDHQADAGVLGRVDRRSVLRDALARLAARDEEQLVGAGERRAQLTRARRSRRAARHAAVGQVVRSCRSLRPAATIWSAGTPRRAGTRRRAGRTGRWRR